MVRMLDARGVPVVCLKDMTRVGYLGEALYGSGREVCGFLVEGGRHLARQYVALDDILRIGKENCVIYSARSVHRLGKMRALLRKRETPSDLVGQDVIRDGEHLGVVHDLAFDMETGMIEGLEISRGFMEDIRVGRTLVLLQGGMETDGRRITIKEDTRL